MRATSVLCLAAALGFTASQLLAQGYVSLTTGDAAPFSSFTNSTHWSDSQYPHGDADYLVSSWLMLRTPENNTSYVFGGRSLTLSNGYMNVKGGGQLTITDLRTYSCRIADGIGGVTPRLYGTNTVYGTSSGYSRYSGSNDRVLQLHTVFQGTGELSFDRTEGETPGYFYPELRGDNSGFAGGMRVVGPNIELRIVHTNGLGGALASFRADALSLVNSGIVYAATSVSLAPPNRGVTLSNGGILRVMSPYVITVTNPVTGTGGLVLRGDGRVDLNAAMTFSGDTTVEGGTLRLGPALSLPAGHRIIMKSGARTLEGEGFAENVTLEGGSINPGTGTAAGQLTVSNLVMAGGALRFDLVNGATADFVRVTGALTKQAPTPITIGIATPGTNDYPAVRRLLTAPNLGDFTLADFALQLDLGGLPEGALDLVDDAGERTLVFRQVRPVIRLTASDASPNSSFTSGARWSDGAVPGADRDYLVAGSLLLRSADSAASSTFNGRSLSIAESGDMRVKSTVATIPDGRLYSGRITQGTPPTTQYLLGNLTVYAPASAPFNVEIEGASATERRLVIGAALLGSGDLRFRAVTGTGQAAGGSFSLTNLNTGFTGGININAFKSIELSISDELNLGANPTAFRADQLKLTSNGVLFAASSLTIDDANRGLTMDTVGGVLRAETNTTLTVSVPITGPGKLTQRGAGTLVLSGANSYRGGTTVESNATLEVRAPWALGSNAVSFAQNTTLRIPYDPDGLPLGLRLGGATPLTIATTLRVRPLFAEGATLPRAFDLPLFLLMQATTDPSSSLALEGTPVGYTAEVSTRTVSDGGTPRTQVFAHYLFAGTLMQVQ
jgi:autotransporter-associated beta strand protein